MQVLREALYFWYWVYNPYLEDLPHYLMYHFLYQSLIPINLRLMKMLYVCGSFANFKLLYLQLNHKNSLLAFCHRQLVAGLYDHSSIWHIKFLKFHQVKIQKVQLYMNDIYEYVCNIYQCKKVRSIVGEPDNLNNKRHIIDMLIFSYIL